MKGSNQTTKRGVLSMIARLFDPLEKHGKVPQNSKLISLSPFIDDTGLLRVGGRLKNAPLKYDQKHPLLLPKNHSVTNLLIESIHKQQLHGGCQTTIAALRRQYWILSCRNAVRKIIFQCIKCFRANPKSYPQLMGDLPAPRVTPSRPFTVTGIDYAGPIVIKNGYGRTTRTVKSYIAIFVCFATRAVHIELVCECSTSTFLNALKRFISRRGKPSHLYSDNATNFIGANRELRNLFKQANFNTAIEDHLANEQISWHFIPPRSPHMGGLWEAAVKSTKGHLKRVIGNVILNYEELSTLLTMIEACLNSRPLTPVSNDPADFSALTPGHFLIGDALTSPAEPDLAEIPCNRLNRYQLLMKLRQHFWSRWSKEYLHQLQQRTKWTSTIDHPQENTLVVLREDNVPPLQWPLGRIHAVHPGPDGVIRVVSVKSARGIYNYLLCIKRWVEYFGEVYGIGEDETLETEEEESLTTGECEEPPRKEEIKEIIKRFKNNKAPGENGITAEMLKVGGQNLEENILKLINKAWDEETIPQRWKETLICPLHKKGDRFKCENYRGQYQCGFRKNRSVMDQVFVLKQIMDNSIDQNSPLYMLFIDFKQAYDTIKREKVYEAMRQMGIGEKLIRLVRMTLKETEYKDESYFCTTVRVVPDQSFYIVGFEPTATMDVVHHMIVFGCSKPGTTDQYWDCGEMASSDSDSRFKKANPCADGLNVIYAWALNAKPLKLPENVGFQVGKGTQIQYLVLQIHYSKKFKDNETDNSGLNLIYTEKPQSKLAGVLLLGTGGTIPPRTVTHMETLCQIKEQKTIHPFAYRTHTHELGKVVSGYSVRRDKYGDDRWSLLGKRNPYTAQMFYPIFDKSPIEYGDRLAARCTMDSTNKTQYTIVGERWKCIEFRDNEKVSDKNQGLQFACGELNVMS
ncbi:hypothetical protein GEV33_006031 [Tenebrio molitor]|uniref:peptidylglycine monooxygenase n=1 Tax=Tenebrio molitor TaxID=7067 RepID=A0A8J6HDE7_TENMO|nr:hypothetical protein GEV33_006031 [Tenebrio molitor]